MRINGFRSMLDLCSFGINKKHVKGLQWERLLDGGAMTLTKDLDEKVDPIDKEGFEHSPDSEDVDFEEEEGLIEEDIIKVTEPTDNDILSERAEQIKTFGGMTCAELIRHATSSLNLVSYNEELSSSYCDITEASLHSVQALIVSSEKKERLNYVHILCEILNVAQRHAGIVQSRDDYLRSPNLDNLISFINKKETCQEQRMRYV